MIIGNLQALQQAGLPPALKQLLSSEACSLAALSARENGRFQPDDAPWFCTLSVVQTQPAAERHTEYHRQWADIQVILAGEERIQAGMAPAMRPEDHELKPDLYICQPAPESVSILLRPRRLRGLLPRRTAPGAVCGFDASAGQKGSIQNPR
ncbi:YhcH/YjgK/YiaL family protein [Klebsiella pneumoniae]|nr:YhcH/YjgK/YiaL family protein [Klebsiella pneumoniae]